MRVAGCLAAVAGSAYPSISYFNFTTPDVPDMLVFAGKCVLAGSVALLPLRLIPCLKAAVFAACSGLNAPDTAANGLYDPSNNIPRKSVCTRS